jgi:asparagine synthase (glutamine-hydrolysing)
MANSVELRSPFLDHRLVEYSWTLPGSALIRGGVRKRITRELFLRSFRPELLQSRKFGFGLPIDDWLLGPLRHQTELAIRELRGREEFPMADYLAQKYWPRLMAGDKTAAQPIWLIYAFWRWSIQQRHSATDARCISWSQGPVLEVRTDVYSSLSA